MLLFSFRFEFLVLYLQLSFGSLSAVLSRSSLVTCFVRAMAPHLTMAERDSIKKWFADGLFCLRGGAQTLASLFCRCALEKKANIVTLNVLVCSPCTRHQLQPSYCIPTPTTICCQPYLRPASNPNHTRYEAVPETWRALYGSSLARVQPAAALLTA